MFLSRVFHGFLLFPMAFPMVSGPKNRFKAWANFLTADEALNFVRAVHDRHLQLGERGEPFLVGGILKWANYNDLTATSLESWLLWEMAKVDHNNGIIMA